MWITPKTDWKGETINGVYQGDYFNAADYNRIKNNLTVLNELVNSIYPEIAIVEMGEDKTPKDFLYADEITRIEKNFDSINQASLRGKYGEMLYFYENDSCITYDELNRIESAMLDLYNKLTNQKNGRRSFTWNFGVGGV